MKKIVKTSGFAIIFLVLVNCAVADVTPAVLIKDHMVLQREKEVPVWGTADPGEAVIVRFAGQEKKAIADDKGRWMVKLSAMKANAKGQDLVIEGKNRVVIEDVLIGEVWYASGQSNMWYAMRNIAAKWPVAGEALAAADFLGIRFYRINGKEKGEIGWEISSPSVTASFAATAFFFARKLHRDLGVPVAVIDGSIPAKPIEPFISRDILKEMPKLNSLLEGWKGRDDQGVGNLHDEYAEPVVPYGIKGFIWYQGESNTGDPVDYALKMEGLIRGWRSKWDDETLPFYWVQLSSISMKRNGWPYLREEQRLAMNIPYTGMAVIGDLDGSGIHPLNKIDVGERLARWALAKQYGRSIAFSGPLFKSAKVEGNSIHVTFDHAESGLMTGDKEDHLPVKETPDVPVTKVQVADAKYQWHDADSVTIDGSTLVVSCTNVAGPVAVRYAYAPTTHGCNLYSKDGLPASPFVSKPEIRDPSEIFIDPKLHALYQTRTALNKATKAMRAKYKGDKEYRALYTDFIDKQKARDQLFVERFADIAAKRAGAGRSSMIKRAVSKLTGPDIEENKKMENGIADAEAALTAWLIEHDEEYRMAKEAYIAALEAVK